METHIAGNLLAAMHKPGSCNLGNENICHVVNPRQAQPHTRTKSRLANVTPSVTLFRLPQGRDHLVGPQGLCPPHP